MKDHENLRKSKRKTTLLVLLAVVALIIFSVIGVYVNQYKESEWLAKMSPERRAVVIREKQVKEIFNDNRWKVEKAIKQSMNDPDSYKHVETLYIDNTSYLMVYTQFRGKNAYGGVVTQNATARMDLQGNVSDVQF